MIIAGVVNFNITKQVKNLKAIYPNYSWKHFSFFFKNKMKVDYSCHCSKGAVTHFPQPKEIKK